MGSRKRKLNKNKQTETITSPMDDYGFNSTTYDDEDRLTAWSRPDNYSQSWTLSEVGEWDTFADNAPAVTRLYNDVHELTTNNGTSVVHDAKGNLTTNSNAQTYTWDFDNRMDSATVGTDTHTYAYDALGRRVSKTVMTDGGDPEEATATTVFIYDGQQVIAEYTSGADPESVAPLRKYVYASYIDEPVLMLAGTTKYYYHQNALYNVVALTNTSGIPVERYAYTAYGVPTLFSDDGLGNLTQISTSAINNPYTYTGRRLDNETGLYYYRARYYDADLGRFIGRDPIGYLGESLCLYQYVNSSPAVLLDSMGTCASCNAFAKPLASTPPVTTSASSAIAIAVFGSYAEIARKECNLRIQEHQKSIDESKQNGGSGDPFEVSELPDADNKCCEAMRDRALQRNPWLEANTPASCQVTIECKKCSSDDFAGWAQDISTPGQRASRITLCWSSRQSSDSIEQLLLHEYTHALQTCHWNPPTDDNLCENYMQREMMAYNNAGQCHDFLSCLKRALGSCCRADTTICNASQMDLGAMLSLYSWFQGMGDIGIPVSPTPPSPKPTNLAL